MVKECRKIGIEDIEEMILLGDDVVKQVCFNHIFYDIDDGLRKYVKQSDYSLADALDLSAEDLLEEVLKPYIPKALEIFRNGAIQDTVLNETNFCADDDVSEEYLEKLFAMRIRDLMIVHGSQRGTQVYYFLLWSAYCCHDMDEWIGIYTKISDLRRAYEQAQKEGNIEPNAELMIYQFDDNSAACRRVYPKDLWGEENEKSW